MWWRASCLIAVVLVWAGTAAGATLVAWYEFENTAADSSGNGYDGVAAGAPGYVAGQAGYGQAIHIDAVDDTVTWAGLPTPSSFTVSIWVKLDPNATTVNGWLLDHINVVGSSWKGWQIKVAKVASGTGGTVSMMLADGSFVRRTTSATVGTLFDGQWHQIVGTHDGLTTARLYVDGNQVGQTTGYGYTPPPSTQVMTLNKRAQTAIYPGDVDDISVWSGAMSANEVMALFRGGMSVGPGALQAVVALEGFGTPNPNLSLQSYSVSNCDLNATRTISISEVDAGGAATDYNWLTLSASQLVIACGGTGTVTPAVDHVAAALAPGVYTAYVRFTDDAVPAHVETRQIRLSVLGCQWAAVSPGDVKRYHLSGSSDPVGPVVYTVNNTGKHGLTYTVQEVVDEPWLTLSATGGGPLNYQASDTVTATINPAGLAVGQYTCTLRFTNNCSPVQSQDRTITLKILPDNYTVSEPGLLAYYRFEDSLRDWTGNGWNGLATGAPTYEEGQDGRSIRFHGITTTDGVDLGDIPCPASTESPAMTVAVWYRGKASEIEVDASWLLNKITSAGATGWEGWQIKVDHEWFGLGWEVPTIQFRWCHDGLRDSLDTSNPNRNIAIPTLYDGNWHQIVMTIEDVNGAADALVNVRGYYDGKLIQGQNIWNQQPDVLTFERLGTKFVAAPVSTNVWLSGDVDRVMGGVDELSFWSRALNAAEIQSLFSEGLVDRLPWPDSDEDGDVDMNDFAAFQRCYTIGGGNVADACARFDHDHDGDIDEIDMNAFRDCATGSGIAIDEQNPPAGCDL